MGHLRALKRDGAFGTRIHTQAAADESLMGISTYPLYVTTADASKTLATATWTLDEVGEAPTPVVREGEGEGEGGA